MKTRLHSSFAIRRFPAALLAVSCFGALPALGQNLPPLSQIVSNVTNATRPAEAYTATVTQTLSPPDTNVMAATMAAGSEAEAMIQTANVETFETTFDPARREWVTGRARPQTLKAKVASQPGTNEPPAQPRVRVTVDMASFLESLLSSTEVSLAQEALNGRSCYRIDARSGGERATLWVDDKRWHVSKGIIYLQNRKFAEVNSEYRDVNGRWLTSKSTIDFALDGSRADLEFGEYKRAARPK